MKNIENSLEFVLTDLQLHSTKPVNPDSFQRKLEKSSKNGKKGRCYSMQIKLNEKGELEFEMDLPKSIKGKDVKLFIPKDGVSIKLGKDTIEKIKSISKK